MKVSRLKEKVINTLSQYDMLSGSRVIAVGLSGGADSVSLVHCLCSLSREYSLRIRAVHINHMIRAAEADRDEQFVSSLCDRLNIPLDIFRIDVPAIAAQRKLGLEECGRDCRYECFDNISAQYGCTVATAHTLSDSAETVLFDITRGCGISGLRGIPPKRGIFIRPLILCTRADVEEYCGENALEFVNDSTNADTAYSRNRIRHDVIPALTHINPAFHEAVRRLSESARRDDECLCEIASGVLNSAKCGSGWRISDISSQPEAVRRRAIMQIITSASGHVPESRHIALADEYLQKGSGAVEICAGYRFSVSGGVVRIDCAQDTDDNSSLWEVPLGELPEVGCETIKNLPDGRIVHLRVTEIEYNDKNSKIANLLFKNCVDCDIITDNTLLRFRRAGDRYTPPGSPHSKKLKKLLCDMHIDRQRRDNLLILSDSDNILWLEDLGASQAACVTQGTARILSLSITDA